MIYNNILFLCATTFTQQDERSSGVGCPEKQKVVQWKLHQNLGVFSEFTFTCLVGHKGRTEDTFCVLETFLL